MICAILAVNAEETSVKCKAKCWDEGYACDKTCKTQTDQSSQVVIDCVKACEKNLDNCFKTKC